MSSFSNRRQPATRTGRPAPNLHPTYNPKMEKPKIAVNELYHLDEAASGSPVVPSVLNCASNRLDYASPSAPSSNHPSVPVRAQFVRPITSNSISFPVMSSSSTGPSAPKRAPTPPPSYAERVSSQENVDVTTAPPASRSRSRNNSASSWIKRVVSRSSSRASLRKQYEQIPMTEDERRAAEEIRARRAELALAEWNRVNNALKNAGF